MSKVMRFNICNNQNPHLLNHFDAFVNRMISEIFFETDKPQNILAGEYIGASEPPKCDIKYF